MVCRYPALASLGFGTAIGHFVPKPFNFGLVESSLVRGQDRVFHVSRVCLLLVETLSVDPSLCKICGWFPRSLPPPQGENPRWAMSAFGAQVLPRRPFHQPILGLGFQVWVQRHQASTLAPTLLNLPSLALSAFVLGS